MNNLYKLFRSSNLVITIIHRFNKNTFKQLCYNYPHQLFFNANMSQRSITSFFKATPKNSTNLENSQEDSVSSSEFIQSVPSTNGKNKISSKRQRADSSSSDSSQKSAKTSPITDEKAKKSKRQRIESSGSEPDSSKLTDESLTDSIKLEKKESIKTYASPKSNKSKIKKESSSIVKEEKRKSKSPSPVEEDKDEKTEVRKTKSRSSSPIDKKAKVTQKKSPDTKKIKKESSLEKDKDVSEVKKDSDQKLQENGEIVPETEYNPNKPKYHPIKDACWGKRQEVPYLALARTLEAIEATSSRLKMIEILSNYFRSVIVLTPEDLLPSVYMCLNQLAPAYYNLELGIAETYLMKAVGQCTGRTLAQMKSAAQKTGDLGTVAEQARSTQKTMFQSPPLKARRVFAALKEIANMTGQASVNKKIAKIQSLYVACRQSEAKYLIRSLEGKLRIGLAEQSLLQALALAATLTPPGPDGVTVLDASKGVSPDEFKKRVDESALTVKTTYCECPDYGRVLPALLEGGVAQLAARCPLSPGVPLKPMLAHPARSVADLLHRFENEDFTCEWKYDGERAQIHVPAICGPDGAESGPDFGKAAIFSRNQENNTSKYPDILRRLPSLLKPTVTSCVLDCEAVAYDTVNKQILPFQVLSTRKRKQVVESDVSVQVCVFVFDALYLNGRALVRRPLADRRDLLRDHFLETEGEWQLAAGEDCRGGDTEGVQRLMEAAVRGSCEGLMVKALRGPRAAYDIARRSRNWLKLKKDYLEGCGDSIDAVIIGAYRGRGRRAGVYGGFLLACYDPECEEYQSLCKIGTGFSDDDLAHLTKELDQHAIDAPRTYYRFDPSHAPDAWFGPSLVAEVRCADVSLSSAHRAARGRVEPERGLSLRFPRFVRLRADKRPEQAVAPHDLVDLYLAQDQVKNSAPTTSAVDADDFY